jgi:hypothetical protein
VRMARRDDHGYERRTRLSAADQRARDRLVLEARSQGTTWPEIGARFSLSQSAARRASTRAAKLAAEQGLADLDVGALLEQIVRTEARALYRLDELLHDANTNVAVGAARAVGIVGRDLRRSLSSCGLLPETGTEIRFRGEIRALVRGIVRASEEAGVPLDVLERALDAEPSVPEWAVTR